MQGQGTQLLSLMQLLYQCTLTKNKENNSHNQNERAIVWLSHDPRAFPIKGRGSGTDTKCTQLQKQELKVGDKAQLMWFSG